MWIYLVKLGLFVQKSLKTEMKFQKKKCHTSSILCCFLFWESFRVFWVFLGYLRNCLYLISGESGRQQFSISANCSVVKSLVPLDTLALLSLSSFWFSGLATENRLRVMICFESFEGTTLDLSPFWYFIEFVGCSFCMASLLMANLSWFICIPDSCNQNSCLHFMTREKYVNKKIIPFNCVKKKYYLIHKVFFSRASILLFFRTRTPDAKILCWLLIRLI